MALFRKLKNNVGVDEEKEKGEEEKEEEIEEDDEEEEEEMPTKKSKKDKEKKGGDRKKSSGWLQSKGQLAADVFETETEFCVQAPIAGINQDEIEIFVENDMLVIKGERTEPDNGKTKRYFYQECYWGPFSRQIILPEDVNSQRVKASFKKGVLLVSIPKKQTERKKITIEIEE